MREFYKIIILFVIANFVTGQSKKCNKNCKRRKVITTHGTYIIHPFPYFVKVFEDDFSSNQIDESLWWPNNLHRTCNDGEQSCLMANNVYVNNGILYLEAKREYIPNCKYLQWESYSAIVCDNKLNSVATYYSGARLNGKWRFPYGRYEARIKIPKGKGLWSAFYVYDGVQKTGNYSEIDIFEFWTEKRKNCQYKPNLLSKVHHTNIYNDDKGTVCSCSQAKRYSNMFQGFPSCFTIMKDPCFDFSKNFTTFTVDWLPDVVRWWIDGNLVREEYKVKMTVIPLLLFNVYIIKTLYAFPSIPMKFMLALGVESGKGSFGSCTIGPDPSDPFTKNMQVDYVRYYAPLSNCSDIKDVHIKSCNYTLHPDFYNYIIGNNIHIEGGSNCFFQVDSTGGKKYRLEVIGRNGITLGPNFVAKEGTYFTARTDPLSCMYPKEYFSNSDTLLQYPPYKVESYVDTMNVVNIYPNPANSYVNIYIPVDGNYDLEVVNVLGESVIRKRNVEIRNDEEIALNIEDLPIGIYFIEITNKELGFRFVEKLAKN